MTNDLDTSLCRDNAIIHAPVGEDDLVMLSVDGGRYYAVKGVGRRLWELLEQPRTPTELSAAICAEFEVDGAACAKDIDAFLQTLLDNGLVHAAGV